MLKIWSTVKTLPGSKQSIGHSSLAGNLSITELSSIFYQLSSISVAVPQRQHPRAQATGPDSTPIPRLAHFDADSDQPASAAAGGHTPVASDGFAHYRPAPAGRRVEAGRLG